MSLLKKISKHIDKSAAIRAVAVALILVLTFCICGFDARCDTIRENVLRLHVLANSDSAEDQALKLKVRDALLKESEDMFKSCNSESEAAESARENLARLQQVAQQTVYDNGYTYPVTVEVAKVWFETRHYEEFTLPAGEYEALRVVIGDGAGKNWWCVMFPAVCISSAGKDQGFSKVLNDDTAEIVEKPKQYKARFKVVELFQKARRGLSKFF